MKLFHLIYFLLISIGQIIPREIPQHILAKSLADLQKQSEIHKLQQAEFSVPNFLKYLELLEVPNKEIVVRQAILESRWFKSSLTVGYNNLFGMMHPGKSRETTATGVAFTYEYVHGTDTVTYHPCKYKTWTDSVDDYILFVKYWEKRGYDSSNDYYTFLNDIGYCRGEDYVRLLKSINMKGYIS